MLKRVVVFIAVLVPLALPAVASAHGSSRASGVVIKIDRPARMVAVRQAQARVTLVHTSLAGRLRVGERVRMRARELRDGTLSASSIVVVGEAEDVAVRGTVVRIQGDLVTVSTGGATLGFRDERAGSLSVGSQVMLRLKFDEGQVEVEDVEAVLPQVQGVSVEGHLTIAAGTVTVSDHDVSITGTVPSGFDLAGFRTGDEVLATFAIQPNGTLVLTRLTREDVNEEQAQPNGNDNNGASGDGDHGGDGGGGDGGHDGGGGDNGGDSGGGS
jgi:uncharacterized membrane protein YgcG